MQNNYESYISILRKEIIPALGCTEPIAVALATAKAVEVLGTFPEEIEMNLSGNIIKNGMGVGIPGTGKSGLHIASALGATGGNASKSLEVFADITEQNVIDAIAFVKENKVKMTLAQTDEKLFIEINVIKNNQTATVIISGSHTNIVAIKKNDEYIQNDMIIKETEETIKTTNPYPELTIENILEFAKTVEFNDIKFIFEMIEMNKTIANDGLKNDFGLKIAKTMDNNIKSGRISEDMGTNAIKLTVAAADARMGGSFFPVMTNSGSGNQGLTVSLPIYSFAKSLNVNDEVFARALVLGNLTAIHIKSFLGKLSPLCGATTAAMGASAGITWLLGGDFNAISGAIKTMIANVTGIICDGAKPGCALKVSSSVNAAIEAAYMAIDNTSATGIDGIVDRDIEKSIENLATIGNIGMRKVDSEILNILTK